jgi:hypothetical protein
MRTKTAIFALAALAACVVGCGSSDDSAPAAGAAGTGGTGGGAGGVAGADAGPDGVVDTDATDDGVDTGAGGDDGGSDAADETAGAGGTGGIPIVDLCDGVTPQRPLPYNIAQDFTYPNNITPMNSVTGVNVTRWVRLANPDCDMTFSDSGPAPVPPEFTAAQAAAAALAAATDEGGLSDAAEAAATDDGAAEASDGAAEGSADALADVVAGDVSLDASPVSDAARGDAPVDGASPACWGFYYYPDDCTNLVNDGGAGTAVAWQCWGGAIFEAYPPGGGADAGGIEGGGTDPANLPGICIETGATNIEFWARASREPATVKFGSTRAGVGTTEEYLRISTTWQKYSISVPFDYRFNSSLVYGVFNGFSVVVEPSEHVGGSYIFVRDVTWVNVPPPPPATADGGD